MSIRVKNYVEQKYGLDYQVVEYLEASTYYPQKVYYYDGWRHMIIEQNGFVKWFIPKTFVNDEGSSYRGLEEVFSEEDYIFLLTFFKTTLKGKI